MEQEHTESFSQSNDGYTSAGVIQLRLDTGPMLDQLEAFFRGRRIVGYSERGGSIVPQYGPAGTPKMNDEGVQSLMSWLTPLFSPHTVQGNFKDRQELNVFLCYLQKGLAKNIMANREKWGIRRSDYSGIIREIMCAAEPFFTRLLENKERESYANTMRTVENNKVDKGGFSLNPFNKG